MIQSRGYEATFLTFGLFQGAAVFVLAVWLRQAPRGYAQPSAQQRAHWAEGRDCTPAQMLTTPVFWIMYAMFVMMAAGGLMATAQLGPIALDFKIADVPVSLVGITLPALTFALSIDRALNGVTRPFFGWLSDHLGREQTMFLAFMAEGLGILLLSRYGHRPVPFVILSGLVFFAWGEIYSLFPATSGDTFGSRYAAANAGILYTAKGTAALFVPLASVLAATGGWGAVFAVASGLNLAAAAMALWVLKPARRAYLRSGTSGGTS
jgi:OFA family oxalate/formate antiporter-like MFS transporter